MRTLTLFILVFNLPTLAQGDIFAKAKKRALEAADQVQAEVLSKTSPVLKELQAESGKSPEDKRTSATAPARIKKLDFRWREWSQKLKGKSLNDQEKSFPSFVRDIFDRKCSAYLRSVMTKNSEISEIFVTNHLGEVVCLAEPTSDYDQGDENKWLKPFLEDVSPYQGAIKSDPSTKTVQVQVSYLIKENDTKMGVLTVGVKPRRGK